MPYILVRSKMNLSNAEELFKGTTTYIDFDQEIAQDRSALYKLIKANLSDLKPESSFGQEGPCTCWTNKPPYQVLNVLELKFDYKVVAGSTAGNETYIWTLQSLSHDCPANC